LFTSLLLAGLFLLIIWNLYSRWQVVAQPPLIEAPTTTARASPPVAGQIVSGHLFGTADAQQPAQKIEAPVTQLSLTLRGIVAAQGEHPSFALIANGPAEEEVFLRGDEVFSMATISEIHADRVILLRNGQPETLRMPEEPDATAAAAATGFQYPIPGVNYDAGAGEVAPEPEPVPPGAEVNGEAPQFVPDPDYQPPEYDAVNQ
jgi:general secretion pathway protein C